MKTAILLLILAAASASGAMAGETNRAPVQVIFRDPQGRRIGTASGPSGGLTTFRNNAGVITGTARAQASGRIEFRDPQGRIVATAEKTGPRKKP